jgi:carbonic anhydrase/acetyltransferase-like protein (isoleucine patch superfamily)
VPDGFCGRARPVRRVCLLCLWLAGAAAQAQPSIDSTAQVDASASIGERTVIDAGAVVNARARIGADVYIGPRAWIGSDAVIGDAAQIGPGTVIGRGATIGSGVRLPGGLEISADAIITQRGGVDITAAPPVIEEQELPPAQPYAIKGPAGGADYPHTFALKLDVPADIDIADPMAVFRGVFAALPDHTTVMPTENYLYFRFETTGSHVWGNLRLSPRERDEGVLHFAYFEFNEDPRHQEDFYSNYRRLGADQGVALERVAPGRYQLSFDGRSVVLALQEVPQTPPAAERLRPDETWVLTSCDESGLYFQLLFNRTSGTFLWMLDENHPHHDSFQSLSDDVLLAGRTGFVFYRDTDPGRLILIGIDRQNIKQNNYYDGPFDQLADNYIDKESPLAEFIQRAYPYTEGHIDEYGHFRHNPSSRVAITPYYAYYETGELPEMVVWCRDNRSGAEFYACIAYDHKTRYP